MGVVWWFLSEWLVRMLHLGLEVRFTPFYSVLVGCLGEREVWIRIRQNGLNLCAGLSGCAWLGLAGLRPMNCLDIHIPWAYFSLVRARLDYNSQFVDQYQNSRNSFILII